MRAISDQKHYQEALINRNACLIRAFLRCRYFGDQFPSLEEWISLLRVPKAVLEDALQSLYDSGFIFQNEEGSQVIELAPDLPRIAFFCNQSLISSYGVVQDYLIGAEEIFSKRIFNRNS